MKPEEIRIAIAEACGWKVESSGNRYSDRIFNTEGNSAMRWKQYGGAWLDEWLGAYHVPDYLNDLNACYEMVESLDWRDRRKFTEKLSGITETEKGDHWDDAHALCHATAAQRCEAFLKAKGLWRE